MYSYSPEGVCSREIIFDVEDGVVTECKFLKGCSGNAQGIGRLVVGRRVEDVIDLLRGIKCQNGTSCPDQLARALQAHLDAGGATAAK